MLAMTESVPALDPIDWGTSFSKPPEWCSGPGLASTGALFRTWRHTAAQMEQPPLTHHYLVRHESGPKRVTRATGARVVTADVAVDSISLASAGTAHRWSTDGPIGFTHLYLAPGAVDDAIAHGFDRDPLHVHFREEIGRRAPLFSALFDSLEVQLKTAHAGARLLIDTLMHHILVQLVAEFSDVHTATDRPPHAIAPHRLSRVLDYIKCNLGGDIGLAELATIAGSSRYHFSRAFRAATGVPPYRYLIERRIDEARHLLQASEAPIGDIALTCGFHSRRQFEAMFRRVCGTSPARYRHQR